MKRGIRFLLYIVLISGLSGQPKPQLPKVLVIATGGTIAGEQKEPAAPEERKYYENLQKKGVIVARKTPGAKVPGL